MPSRLQGIRQSGQENHATFENPSSKEQWFRGIPTAVGCPPCQQTSICRERRPGQPWINGTGSPMPFHHCLVCKYQKKCMWQHMWMHIPSTLRPCCLSHFHRCNSVPLKFLLQQPLPQNPFKCLRLQWAQTPTVSPNPASGTGMTQKAARLNLVLHKESL